MPGVRRLYALVDQEGEVIGGAPWDGESVQEVTVEVLKTYADIAMETLGWKVVPLNPELEAKYKENR